MKKKLLGFTLLIVSTLLLSDCEHESNNPTSQDVVHEKGLNIEIYHWHQWEHDHVQVVKKLQKFRRKDVNSREITSSEYGFTIDENIVQVINQNGYTTHTFIVKRDIPQEGVLENYLYKEFDDGSFKQFLLTYYYITDSEGNKTLDKTDMGIQIINDDNLVINRSESDCFPHFEEVFTGIGCTYRERCTGRGTHEEGDSQCTCTGLNGCYPAGETCEAEYGYVYNDCGGGSGGTDDNSDTTNPNDAQTGGGDATNPNSGTDNGTTTSVPFDYDTRLNDFLNSLNDTQSSWWNSSDNETLTDAMYHTLLSNAFSNESQIFISFIIDELLASSDFTTDEILDVLELFTDNDWIRKLKRALAIGVTSTAEFAHEVYNEIDEITSNNPLLLDAMNLGIDGLRSVVNLVTDTNHQTATWKDLFNMWLFELGDDHIFFDGNDATTLQLKNQEGVNDARDKALELIGQGDLNIPPHQWQYGQQEFYDGMVNGNIVTTFLGSYIVYITAVYNGNGFITLNFRIENTSGWSSATRLRIDNDQNGQHDSIISDKPRGTGILLGGNFKQTWTWSETY